MERAGISETIEQGFSDLIELLEIYIKSGDAVKDIIDA